MRLRAQYYQQFDADFDLEVPAEAYGGWHAEELELAPEHTALVVMHAWDCGTREAYPGWHRCVEYIPRAEHICAEVLPPLLAAVRESPLRLYHVVGWDPYYKHLPGYKRAAELAGPPPPEPPRPASDPTHEALQRFRTDRVFPGAHNVPDIERGVACLDFMPQVRPLDHEGVAEDAHQLGALCHADGVNHLIYTGFAINWCVLASPGGMVDMNRRGIMCSAIREGTAAVENKETARGELAKEIALWRVSVMFGFVFGAADFLAAVRGLSG
jgi:hypothetical protein